MHPSAGTILLKKATMKQLNAGLFISSNGKKPFGQTYAGEVDRTSGTGSGSPFV
jgi:hypothetical protein